jgi:hypothetical protein
MDELPASVPVEGVLTETILRDLTRSLPLHGGHSQQADEGQEGCTHSHDSLDSRVQAGQERGQESSNQRYLKCYERSECRLSIDTTRIPPSEPQGKVSSAEERRRRNGEPPTAVVSANLGEHDIRGPIGKHTGWSFDQACIRSLRSPGNL